MALLLACLLAEEAERSVKLGLVTLGPYKYWSRDVQTEGCLLTLSTWPKGMGMVLESDETDTQAVTIKGICNLV